MIFGSSGPTVQVQDLGFRERVKDFKFISDTVLDFLVKKLGGEM